MVDVDLGDLSIDEVVPAVLGKLSEGVFGDRESRVGESASLVANLRTLSLYLLLLRLGP